LTISNIGKTVFAIMIVWLVGLGFILIKNHLSIRKQMLASVSESNAVAVTKTAKVVTIDYVNEYPGWDFDGGNAEEIAKFFKKPSWNAIDPDAIKFRKLYDLSQTQYEDGRLTEAVKTLSEALVIVEKQNDPVNLWRTYNRFDVFYFQTFVRKVKYDYKVEKLASMSAQERERPKAEFRKVCQENWHLMIKAKEWRDKAWDVPHDKKYLVSTNGKYASDVDAFIKRTNSKFMEYVKERGNIRYSWHWIIEEFIENNNLRCHI